MPCVSFKKGPGGSTLIMGWIEGPAAEAADLRGVNNFLLDIMDDEDYVCGLMDLCVQVGIDFAQAQIEAGADTIGIGDAVASQLSPRIYNRLVQPREKQMVDAVHQSGARVRLHICGNIKHLLPGIAGLGVDILDVDHMVDMAEARKAVGNKAALAGNLDPVAGVCNSDPERIRAATREVYNKVNNPYMIAAGCEVPAATPPENLKALCEPLSYIKK